MDVIQIPIGAAITLILAFVGLLFAFGKILVNQFNKSLDQRFIERDEQHRQLRESIKNESIRITELSNSLQKFASAMPLEYVRREDWIRFSATIDHKLDRLGEFMIKAMKGDRQ